VYSGRRMTAVVPDSKGLRAELRALPPAAKQEIRAKRHPWIARPMLILRASSSEGDRLLRDLVDRFGECWWERGRWRVRRVQLRFPLPGF
jgi:hypothetical protein